MRTRASDDARGDGDELPADMSTTSLVGGGLIAGESLYTLGAGIASLLGTLLERGRHPRGDHNL